jgi:hypothetical protein
VDRPTTGSVGGSPIRVPISLLGRKRNDDRARRSWITALVTRSNMMSFVVVAENGPACPRCGRPMQVREHDRIREKQLQQPFYYSRWFRCMHKNCKTTIVHRDEFKVAM